MRAGKGESVCCDTTGMFISLKILVLFYRGALPLTFIRFASYGFPQFSLRLAESANLACNTALLIQRPLGRSRQQENTLPPLFCVAVSIGLFRHLCTPFVL